MNAQQPTVPRMLFAEILRIVNVKRGYFSVAFIAQSKEEQQAIREARTKSEHINYDTARDLRNAEEGAPAARTHGVMSGVLRLMSTEDVADMVRIYTSHQRYSHCELCFYVNRFAGGKDGKDVLGVALHGAGVEIRMRNYTRETYTWRHALCTPEQMIAILRYACAQQGKEYDGRLMAQSATEPGPDVRDAFFCSQFVMACLEHLSHPVLHFRRANAVSNDDIIEVLAAEGIACRHPEEVPDAVLDKTMGVASRYVVAPGESPPPRQGGKKLVCPQ
jgi:hypothetical protein